LYALGIDILVRFLQKFKYFSLYCAHSSSSNNNNNKNNNNKDQQIFSVLAIFQIQLIGKMVAVTSAPLLPTHFTVQCFAKGTSIWPKKAPAALSVRICVRF